jgi:SAM-dependent methyltransferase
MGYDREQTRSYFSRFGTTDRKSDFYQELLTGNVIALARMGEECLVLDVGCGFGRYTDRYEKVCTAVGLDLSIPMLKIAKAKGIGNLVAGDARASDGLIY